MRDIFIAALLFIWVPFILFKPFVGVLLWDWISHMNPHSTAAGFARDFPFLDFVAGMTLAGYVISNDEKRLPAHPVFFLMLIYLAWTVLTTFAGYDPTGSQEKLIQFLKVILFAVMTTLIMQSPSRLKAFVGIMTVSLLFIGVKGGLFTLLSGGAGRVQDAGGMMKDNNQLAVAMVMLIPIVIYWVQHPPRPWLRWPAIISAFLTALAVVGTQSRGGFASLLIVGGYFALRSKRKFTILAAAALAGVVVINVMPDSYFERIDSSASATEDESFFGRVTMWKFATNLTSDHPIEGGGFDVFYNADARRYFMPYGETARAVHSIYFEVLGEHGYGGLLLYMTLIFTGWFSAGTAAREFRHYEETRWLGDLNALIQVSIVGFCVGGALLNIATFDLLYHYLAVVVLARLVGDRLIEKGVTRVEDYQRLKAKEEAAMAEAKNKGFRPEKDKFLKPKTPSGVAGGTGV